MYSLMKWSDEFAAHARCVPSSAAQHFVTYVTRGSAVINGHEAGEGEACYCEDPLSVEAGDQGATLWRWGLAPAGAASGVLAGDGIVSALRMARRIKMFELVPTSKWLFRLDRILNFEGTTGLHSHPGSGIRCMLQGTLRVESQKGENGYARQFGDVWYEEGAYPLVSTVDEGDKATFLRGMILPPEYHGYPDTATWIEGFKAKYDGSELLEDVIVTLR